MEHETDYQRARRQRHEVKKHGVTGSTPREAAKRIKEHSSAKSEALEKAKGGKKGSLFNEKQKEFVRGLEQHKYESATKYR